jgi:hypothetical protein
MDAIPPFVNPVRDKFVHELPLSVDLYTVGYTTIKIYPAGDT